MTNEKAGSRGYSVENVAKLYADRNSLLIGLAELTHEGLAMMETTTNDKCRTHLSHGAGRRLGIMRRALERIFELFPPELVRPLSDQAHTDIQAHLQAFVMNLAGVFDNWAWAFLFRHELQNAVKRNNVSLFKSQTQRYLPASLRMHLNSSDIASWHADYLTGYRDALAHRIPIYVPPAQWNESETAKYKHLANEEWQCIRAQEWVRLEEIRAAKEVIGRPCFIFMHEFSADADARPVLLHPQLLCDSATVIDCGRRFYSDWHECVRPDL